ncbi:MAG: UDP-glucose/GDP-mannose dehydrogenase family protein [Aeromonas sp.]|uniref:UDP-glucose dehydrogenase family protein n=1 Tax=Aeromonas media TaxID=651 RepID=UPI001B42ED2E|nr:UDP-glucose/GDP-mannose dehydrogenase family protein [Aeromonas sp.]MBP6165902.1 UDP-glucose/GDP-mannose dehydrogenase family protein [Aeromonas sp.]MBP8188818.1 UDP-glucose/GDP-mannose dehydrogenase family protein [Aeromonas sp.]MBP9677446.1 UDP-glucose/GDP-mannose dehydrogenase family protein [Aeromonas sp.]
MRVSVFGIGYVGLVQAAVLAEMGHRVTCVDVDAAKVERLKEGMIPIFEPGLAPLVQANHQAGRLQFTTDVAQGVAFAELIFIAVGTPPDEDGSADLQHVLAVAGTIGRLMQGGKVVVNKSTVPVGTANRVRQHIAVILRDRGVDLPLEVVSNPEFLKEGAAVADCLRPDRIIIGTDSAHALSLLEELYAPFNRNRDRIIQMDARSAELTKYAANAMLATKISFMNEMATLAEKLGADIEAVRKGIGADPRIGHHFIYPGCGYGGSCFPKDVKALIHTAGEIGCDAPLLHAVERVNDGQKHKLMARLRQHFGSDLTGRTFALWGLAFKPNTDDMREAPSRVLMEAIWAAGGKVQAFDPEAMSEAQRLYGLRDDLTLCGTQEAALKGADALLICTEWQQFRAPDFELVRQTLKQAVIIDGRNLYDPARLRQRGFTYYAIGRGDSLANGLREEQQQ